MPVNPSTYLASLPLTASQLNTDLYTYAGGNKHAPNGLLFHSTPPMLWEHMSTPGNNQGSSSAGAITQANFLNAWTSQVDNAPLISSACSDMRGSRASATFEPVVPGAGGLAGQFGGWYLLFDVIQFANTTNAGASGAVLNIGGVTGMGDVQLSSTTRTNGSYAIDLGAPGNVAGGAFPEGYCADASFNTFAFATSTDYTGNPCMFGCLWAAPNPGNCVVPSSLPSPPAAWAPASTVTSAILNGAALAAPLQFLNNRPALRVSSALTTSIPNSATVSPTLVPLGALGGTGLDNWSGYSGGTSLYTAPVAGVYLVHGVVNYTASAAGQRMCGIRVNGSTTVWGPSYSATGTGVCRPSVVRLLDLNAGDTVGVVTCQNTGAALTLDSGFTCRLIVLWMAALAASSGSVSLVPPSPNFRWQAGTPGGQLPALFNSRLTNDLYFLIRRPYLLSYQTVQQSGLTNNTVQTITMNSVTGMIHGSAGDNYGGWSGSGTVAGTIRTGPVGPRQTRRSLMTRSRSGSSAGSRPSTNYYAAVRPGWYLVVAGYSQTAPTATAHCAAYLGYYQAGGAKQGQIPQVIGQQVSATTAATFGPGAETISLVYLRAGDFIQPQYVQYDGGATFSTNVGAGQSSFFGAVWVSE